jgi:hypothetical protein
MARKKAKPRGKIRTREHIVADLAVNHVERQVLLCGCTVERIVHDYGLDLILFTYTTRGEVENGNVFIQVKGTEKADILQTRQAVSFRVTRSDLAGWLGQLVPVILVVYDVTADTASWVYIQRYCRDLPNFNLFRVKGTFTVHLPLSQVLNPAAVRHFGVLRDQAREEQHPR